ncbi:MAG: S-4TM family putative pore-forming effector [Firmicutes bacterium]|nr:S-4TM family putative pore-forming effector [Bacillota bacterium]
MFERQNHHEALNYLKASKYCARNYRLVQYFIVFFSVVLCIVGILNRYLVEIAPEARNIFQTQAEISRWINITSVVFIITQIFLNVFLRRSNRLAVNLKERYDCYVYDIALNRTMLMNINPSDIEAMALKMKKHPERFYNYYFKTPEEASSAVAGIDNQHRILKEEYRLMSYVKNFFYLIWISFILVIFFTAVLFDDNFINTLTNMLLPSLAVITLIISSFFIFSETIARLQNAINQLDSQRVGLKRLSDTESKVRGNVMRQNQDAMFLLRLLEFNVPEFFRYRLARKYREEPDLAHSKEDVEKESFTTIFKKKTQSVSIATEPTASLTESENSETPLTEPQVSADSPAEEITPLVIAPVTPAVSEPIASESIAVAKTAEKAPHKKPAIICNATEKIKKALTKTKTPAVATEKAVENGLKEKQVAEKAVESSPKENKPKEKAVEKVVETKATPKAKPKVATAKPNATAEKADTTAEKQTKKPQTSSTKKQKPL